MSNSTPESMRQDARAALQDAQAVQAHARHRLDEHAALIAAAKTRAAELQAAADDSTETPEAAAKWRKAMSASRDEVQMLELQVPALERRLTEADVAVRNARQSVDLAECAAIDAEIEARIPEIREAMKVIVPVYALHCRRTAGGFVDSGRKFGEWLTGGPYADGLFGSLEGFNQQQE